MSLSTERANNYAALGQHTIISSLESYDTANTSIVSSNTSPLSTLISVKLLENNVHNTIIYSKREQKRQNKLEHLITSLECAEDNVITTTSHLNNIMMARYAAKAHSSLAFEADLRSGGEERQGFAEYAKIEADQKLKKAERELRLCQSLMRYERVKRVWKKVMGKIKELCREEEEYSWNSDEVSSEGRWNMDLKRRCSVSS